MKFCLIKMAYLCYELTAAVVTYVRPEQDQDCQYSITNGGETHKATPS